MLTCVILQCQLYRIKYITTCYSKSPIHYDENSIKIMQYIKAYEYCLKKQSQKNNIIYIIFTKSAREVVWYPFTYWFFKT